MDLSPSIFQTHSECDRNQVLSKFQVMQTIPSNAFTKKDEKLSNISKEFRWRIIKLENKSNEIIEISYKLPNVPRMFLSKTGKWIDAEVSEQFDQFVVSEYYVYEKIDN